MTPRIGIGILFDESQADYSGREKLGAGISCLEASVKLMLARNELDDHKFGVNQSCRRGALGCWARARTESGKAFRPADRKIILVVSGFDG